MCIRDRYRSSDRAQRRAPEADPCEILHLLQWVASSCFARKGCAGRAPDRARRGHRRTCNLGRIESPVRTNLVFGSDSYSAGFLTTNAQTLPVRTVCVVVGGIEY